MYFIRLLTLSAAMLSLAVGQIYALEATATGKDVDSLNSDMQINALRSIMEKSLNEMLTCNRKGMLFAPNSPGADADQCISANATVSASTLALGKATATMDIAGCSYAASGEVPCYATTNISELIGNRLVVSARLYGMTNGAPYTDEDKPWSQEMGDLTANFSTNGWAQTASGKCSDEPVRRFYSVEYNASSKSITIGGYGNAGDSASRCKNHGRNIEVKNVRLEISFFEITNAPPAQ